MADRIGQQLGNYRLTKLLGRGGFAEVYLGEHLDLGTMVAIKILHTRVAEQDVTQFRQEARLLASLKHPHIVRVLDFGVNEETPYLIMDYAPHGTLRTRHSRGTRLSASTVVDYVKQIAQGLQYAHDRKIVHRDIKPENMLIGENDEILLSDFGIAVIAQSSHYQSTKDMAGTIPYMAPEQISAHPRPASDQYSLGVVAYEWLCGTRPFHGSYTEIAIKHSVTPPPALREHLSALSPDVEHVILVTLAKQPEHRFASVSAFAQALEQAIQDTLPTEQSRPTSKLSSVTSHLPSSDDITPSSIAAAALPSPPQPLVEEPLGASTAQLDQSVASAVAPPEPSVPEKETDKPVMPRRAILIGAAGIAALGIVGIGVFVIAHQQTSSTLQSSQAVTSQQTQSGNIPHQQTPSASPSNQDTTPQQTQSSSPVGTPTSATSTYVDQDASSRLEAFGRGIDNNIWYSSQTSPNASSWELWLPIQPGYAFNGDPAVGTYQKKLQVFARGSDNSIWHIGQTIPNGAWDSQWQLLQANYFFQGTPAVGNDANGNIEVFARGSDNNIWHNAFVGAWSGWFPIKPGYAFNVT